MKERKRENSIVVRNLHPETTDEELRLFLLSAGRVVNMYRPKDNQSRPSEYAYVDYRNQNDVESAINIMNMCPFKGRYLWITKSGEEKPCLDLSAKIFIGNLPQDMDERTLYKICREFGVLATSPKIVRDARTGKSKMYGFVWYESIEESNIAIQALNDADIRGHKIKVAAAFEKAKGKQHVTPIVGNMQEMGYVPSPQLWLGATSPLPQLSWSPSTHHQPYTHPFTTSNLVPQQLHNFSIRHMTPPPNVQSNYLDAPREHSYLANVQSNCPDAGPCQRRG